MLSAAAKWYDLGLELGLTADYLDTIKKANDDPQDCLRELLRHWLSGVDPQPSWKALVAALRSPAVNYPALANDIGQKRCSTAAEPQIHVQFVSVRHPSPNRVTEPDNDTGGVLHNQFPASRPIPKPRRQGSINVLDDRWKCELVQSFEDITSLSQVSQSQIEKAEQCINYGGTRKDRYHLIDFEKLLNINKVSSRHRT